MVSLSRGDGEGERRRHGKQTKKEKIAEAAGYSLTQNICSRARLGPRPDLRSLRRRVLSRRLHRGLGSDSGRCWECPHRWTALRQAHHGEDVALVVSRWTEPACTSCQLVSHRDHYFLSSPLVYVGVFAATLSSALASIVGAPRILQSVAADEVFPWPILTFFGEGEGPENEPRRAYILTYVIAQ